MGKPGVPWPPPPTGAPLNGRRRGAGKWSQADSHPTLLAGLPHPSLPPSAMHRVGPAPGHLEPTGHRTSPPTARILAPPPPPPSRGQRGSHLCVKSPGAGGKLPATCHKEALFSGEVVLWPAVRQRLSPAQRAPSRPHSAPRSLCSSAQRTAAAPPSSAPRLLSSAGLG